MRKWGGADFWLSIKSVWNTLSCCFVCAFIIGQYHSENNMSSKTGAAGEEIFFLKWKAPWNLTPENDLHRGEITLRSAYKIDYHYVLFLELDLDSNLEAPKYSLVERYVCWNVSWPASADNVVKNWLSLSSKFYSSHCGMSLHQVPMFYFTAKCLGSLILLLLPFFIKLLQ